MRGVDMSIVALAVRRLVAREDGQDLLEYGVLMVLIAIVAIVSVTYVGNTIHTVLWDYVVASF